MAKSKLLPSILLGALAGAAISMLDRTTREKTIETTKTVAGTVSYYAANRDELQEMIAEKVEQAQGLYNGANDGIQSLMSQVEQLKDAPSTIQSMVSDTKAAFDKEDSASH